MSVRLRLSKIRGPGDLGPEQGAQRPHGNGERWLTGGRRKFVLRHTVIGRDGITPPERASPDFSASGATDSSIYMITVASRAFRDAATIRHAVIFRDHSEIADLPSANLKP